MPSIVNTKTLRAHLPEILKRVRHGERIVLVHRSQPVCELVPISDERSVAGLLDEDPLYKASAFGRSTDGRTAADHDAALYGGSAE